MKGNLHVQFLEGAGAARLPTYSESLAFRPVVYSTSFQSNSPNNQNDQIIHLFAQFLY